MVIALAPSGTTSTTHTHHHGLSTGTKAALASVGTLVGGLILLFLILCALGRHKARDRFERKENDNRDVDVEKWAIETPALEYAEKMGEPASVHMLVSREDD